MVMQTPADAWRKNFFGARQASDPENTKFHEVDPGFFLDHSPWFGDDAVANAELEKFSSSVNELTAARSTAL